MPRIRRKGDGDAQSGRLRNRLHAIVPLGHLARRGRLDHVEVVELEIAHQVGIAQLAIEYCNALVDDNADTAVAAGSDTLSIRVTGG